MSWIFRQQHGGAPPVGRIRCGLADSGWLRWVDAWQWVRAAKDMQPHLSLNSGDDDDL